MPDIASLGLEINSKQIVEGTKALDALGTAAAAVEPKIDSVTKASDGLSQASTKVWRFGTDAAKSVDALGEAAQRTGQRYQVSNGQMDDTSKIMRAQAEEARATAQANTALGRSTTQMTLGQQLFIDKLRDQVAVLGMSRTQLLAYQAAEIGVTKETEALIAKMKQFEDAAKAAGEAAKAAAAAKREQERSALTLSSTLGLLAKAYAALKVVEYIKESALLAARYETLGVVVEVVGRNAGYTKAQMDTATDAIARQGITMVESRESATKLVQAHVDLKNATVLARIAQDAAVIGHLNSSDAFDRLVNGISRGNVLILRNIGINVNLQTAYRQMADELGKTTKELTENERVQARLNAVVERGADIAGTYEAAMGTAGKQITSMQRYVQDLKTVVGEAFLEVLTVSVMALTDHLKVANKEVSELSKNQQLHEWGRTLADVFVWVANRVANATTLLQQGAAMAGHVAKVDSINSVYDEKVRDPKTQGDFLDFSGRSDRIRRINSERENMLAQEQVSYLEHLAKLSSQYDKFQNAADEREKAATSKRKAELEARKKVDDDYAAQATALLIANAGKSVEAQQAAQVALANSIYVGTPTYRDTEGREPKPKVDKVESTELADRLARIQDSVNAEKEMYETMSKMDDMFHSAGKMGDEQYYKNKRDYAEAAAKDQIDGYNDQIADLKLYHNATAAESAKHAKQINDIEAKRAAAGVKAEDEMNLLGAKEILRKEAVASASDEAANKYLSGLDQEAKKLEESNAAHETSKGAVERETIARLDLAIAYQKQFMADQAASGATAEEIAQAPAVLKYLEDVRAARARIAAGLDQQQANQFSDKSAEQAIKDWQRAGQSISDSLTDAFGNGGKALGSMFQAYAKGVEGQLRAQRDLAKAKKLADDNPDKIQAIQRAQLEGARAQVGSYADMATAAQGFFNEGSRGYKAMHAASTVLHAAEVSLSLIKGVNAVLTQGEGDPYSAFARMAAMAAIVAGLGVAISGGGGGGVDVAKQRQESQGAGSVFGDSTAKSDSIKRALDLMSDNSSIELSYTQGMLAALRGIQSSLSGLGNLLIRNAGLTGDVAATVNGSTTDKVLDLFGHKLADKIVGGAFGKFAANASNAIFGGKPSVEDTGFKIDPKTLGAALDGGVASFQYTDIKKSGGLLGSTKRDTDWRGLGSEANAQFTMVISSIAASVETATALLGLGGDEFTKRLNGFVIDIGKISLKGMDAEEIQKTLESVFSKLGDNLASYAVAGLDVFAKIGEGPLETLTRIASNYANLDSILASSSTSFGQVGMSSIAARERLIEFAGGIDELASKQSSFNDNFLTEAERLAPVQKYVTDQLTAMGYAGIDTRDKFKAAVLGLANSGALATAAGADTYASLLALADAFAKTHAATVDLTKSEQEIADERKDLQDQLDELTMTSAQLLAKQRNALDASNRALFDQIQVATAAKKAQDEARTSLGTFITQMKSFATSAAGFNNSLVLGSLSGLTPEHQLEEARRQYEQTRIAALAGDATAQGALQGIENTFLGLSQKLNGGDATYLADLAAVMKSNEELAHWAAGKVDVAQASLDALNKQVDGITQLNATMQTVAQGMQYQATLTGNAAMPALTTPMPTAIDFSNYGTAITAPLIAEIKLMRDQLREELRGRREDAKQQTGDSNNVTIAATQQAAQTIVTGVREAVTDGAYAASNDTRKPT